MRSILGSYEQARVFVHTTRCGVAPSIGPLPRSRAILCQYGHKMLQFVRGSGIESNPLQGKPIRWGSKLHLVQCSVGVADCASNGGGNVDVLDGERDGEGGRGRTTSQTPVIHIRPDTPPLLPSYWAMCTNDRSFDRPVWCWRQVCRLLGHHSVSF